MKKYLYDPQSGTHYELLEDGVYYPLISYPEGIVYTIGRYGMLRRRWLEKNHNAYYLELLNSGKLNRHLHETELEIDRQISQHMRKMAKSDGVDEAMKKNDPEKWTELMNRYHDSAEETVLPILICG